MTITFFVILPKHDFNFQTEYDPLERQEQGPVAEPTLMPNHNQSLLRTLKSNMNRAKYLFVPFMLPLALVYFAEYEINQGVAPTLLYPLQDTPFNSYRDMYPMYSTLYQGLCFCSWF